MHRSVFDVELMLRDDVAETQLLSVLSLVCSIVKMRHAHLSTQPGDYSIYIRENMAAAY